MEIGTKKVGKEIIKERVKRNYFHLDPRVNIILIVLVNILMFSYGDSIYVNISSGFAILLIILSGKIKSAVKICVFYICLVIIGKLLMYAPLLYYKIFWGLWYYL